MFSILAYVFCNKKTTRVVEISTVKAVIIAQPKTFVDDGPPRPRLIIPNVNR